MDTHSECSELVFLRDVIADAVADREAGYARPFVVCGSAIGNRDTCPSSRAFTTGLVFVLAKRNVERCWVIGDGEYALTHLSQHSISAIILSGNKDILIERGLKTLSFIYIPLEHLKLLILDGFFTGECSFFNLIDPALFRIAEAIIFHIIAPKKRDRDFVGHLIPGFVQAAFKMASCNNQHIAAQERIYLTFRRLSAIDHYIRNNLLRSIRISELSDIAGYSKFHFIRAMKSQTGYSPHQYILKHRIDKARSLVVKSDIKLADIATELGFQSQAHFTTVFRRLTGLTPGGFRRLFSDQLHIVAGINPSQGLPDLVLATQLGFDRQRTAMRGH